MSLPIHHSDAAITKSEDACDALERIHPVRTRHLTAIYLDGRVEPKSFRPSQREEMLRWIEAHQGVANIYFGVNGPKAGIENVKTKKSDIALGFYIHVDLDDPNALDLIAMLLPAPTFVVFSGGGFQIFWALAEPCTDIDRLERINAAMAKRVGGDHCHNADRVMRVPFTINLPNEKKRARGRTETLAYVVAELTDWTRRYSLDEFPELELTQEQSKSITIRQVTEVELATLPIGDLTRNLIELGHDPEHPPGTAGSRYPSRSEAVFRVCCDLVRIGCAPEAIAGILLNRKYAISASVLEKPNPKQYAERQIVSATDAVSRGWPDTKLSGAPRPTLRNTMLAIRRLGITGEYDEFHRRKVLGGVQLQNYQGELSDDACSVLRTTILKTFGFDPGGENTREAANAICLENTHHPVRDYLRGLEWDGTPRIETWMSVYLGADDTPLTRAIGRIVLVAAVRRIRHPGVKYDTIVVLEGAQGTGKSSALVILAGPENFSDQDILTLDPKAQMEAMEGIWIYEIGELQGLSRADTTKVKAFASRSVDRGRPAYGRFRENRPRQTVFIGTTNEDQYLRDPTGNRRFWPVRTGTIDLEALRRERDQLWAEAASLEAGGVAISLDQALWVEAQVEQEARMEDDPWIDVLSRVAGDLVSGHERISSNQLLEVKLQIPPERQQQYHLKRLAGAMRKLGWTGPKNIKLTDGKVCKGYERKPGDGFVPEKTQLTPSQLTEKF